MFLADTWAERLRRLLTPVHQLATALHLDTTPAQRRRLLDAEAVKVAVDVLQYAAGRGSRARGTETEGADPAVSAFLAGFEPADGSGAEARLRQQLRALLTRVVEQGTGHTLQSDHV